MVSIRAGGDPPTLRALVDDQARIKLVDAHGQPVTKVAAGRYRIEVDDSTEHHNFHLTGQGVDQSTGVGDVERVTWDVELTPGNYDYVCDPHANFMKGSFVVTAPTGPTEPGAGNPPLWKYFTPDRLRDTVMILPFSKTQATVAAGIAGALTGVAAFSPLPTWAKAPLVGVGLLATAIAGTYAHFRMPEVTSTPEGPALTGPTGPRAAGTAPFELKPVVDGVKEPTAIEFDPTNGDMYVAEKSGRIVRVAGDRKYVAADLSKLVREPSVGYEWGIMSMAFHPDFETNRRVFVNYADAEQDIHLSEFQLRDGTLDLESERTILEIDRVEPGEASEHNGGQIAFGPDGNLYLAIGDGGPSVAPGTSATDPTTYDGKILRLDVDTEDGSPYEIPAGNRSPVRAGELPEIWAMGLRNPWRFSIDEQSGDMFVGDVGMTRWEEVNRVPAGPLEDGIAPHFGWSYWEGSGARTGSADDAARANLGGTHVAPYHEYPHADGDSAVTGGYVYHGDDVPELDGRYVFADLTGGFRSLATTGGAPSRTSDRYGGNDMFVTTMGRDPEGELYAADYASGTVFRLVPRDA